MWDWAYLIPMIGVSIPVIAIWTSHQRKLAEMQISSTATNTAEKAAQYASNIQQLEDRVRVLERIVTDKGYDVATQIEALRDQRSVDEGSGVALDFAKKENV
ncbi:MAG: hypothetical protein WA957_03150 [Alteraurantiacibacter sp.]